MIINNFSFAKMRVFSFIFLSTYLSIISVAHSSDSPLKPHEDIHSSVINPSGIQNAGSTEGKAELQVQNAGPTEAKAELQETGSTADDESELSAFKAKLSMFCTDIHNDLTAKNKIALTEVNLGQRTLKSFVEMATHNDEISLAFSAAANKLTTLKDMKEFYTRYVAVVSDQLTTLYSLPIYFMEKVLSQSQTLWGNKLRDAEVNLTQDLQHTQLRVARAERDRAQAKLDIIEVHAAFVQHIQYITTL